MTLADALALLKSAPPKRSIDDHRYQAWKQKVDDALERHS